MLKQEIQLACEPGLQQQLEGLAHLIRHFVDDEVVADPKEPLLPMDSVRALQDLYLASMRAAFAVYLCYSAINENRNNPA